jgi:hypothetical protein
VSKQLSQDELRQLKELCGRCLMDELYMAVAYHNGEKVGSMACGWLKAAYLLLGGINASSC